MAADTFLLKRGTTAAVNAYLPALGEPVYDITLKQFKIGDGVTLGGVPPLNVLTADKLTTARNIALTGSVTGSVNFDGSTDVSITTAVGASLQASLDLKAPLASPSFTGVPLAPTASPGTNTTQLATTAFVAAGDALKANSASPTLTGVPLSTTPAVGTNTTQIATAAMVQSEIANKRAWTTYTPTVTATSGTFTSTTATGKYMAAFGVCHVQIQLTVTTVGTGVRPILSLPLPALAGSANMQMIAAEQAINGKLGRVIITAGLTTIVTGDYLNNDLVTANGCVIYISGSYPIA